MKMLSYQTNDLQKFGEECRNAITRLDHGTVGLTDPELRNILEMYKLLRAFFKSRGEGVNPFLTGLNIEQQSYVSIARARGWDTDDCY